MSVFHYFADCRQQTRAATLPTTTQQNSTTRNAPTQDPGTAHRGDDPTPKERHQHPKRATPNSQNNRRRPAPHPPACVAAAEAGGATRLAAPKGAKRPEQPPNPKRKETPPTEDKAKRNARRTARRPARRRQSEARPAGGFFFFLERTAPPPCGGRPSQKKGKSQNPPHRDKTERNGSQQPDQAQRPTKPAHGDQAAQERPKPPERDKPHRQTTRCWSKPKKGKAHRNPQAQKKVYFIHRWRPFVLFIVTHPRWPFKRPEWASRFTLRAPGAWWLQRRHIERHPARARRPPAVQ